MLLLDVLRNAYNDFEKLKSVLVRHPGNLFGVEVAGVRTRGSNLKPLLCQDLFQFFKIIISDECHVLEFWNCRGI